MGYNTNWRDVPLPERMKSLPRDRRGFPVPVIVLHDTDGVPHFTINDENQRQRVIREERCSICGQPLAKHAAIVGGPGSAFHPNGAFLDPPMHPECARYALKVCPYLAAPVYSKRIDAATMDPAKMPPGVVGMKDHTMIPERPDVFCLVVATVFEIIREPGSSLAKYIKPVTNRVTKVEFWDKGRLLTRDEGVALSKAGLAKLGR